MVTQYGMRLYRHGVELRSDGRRRERLPGGRSVVVPQQARSAYRGKVRAWSPASAKRLAFVAANADLFFAAHLTLTYRATQEAWETAGDRNRRFVNRCRADLHRFLRCLREEIGEYLWVREFQIRGVVHFHVLCERAIPQERATVAWGRASDQIHDADVLRHGVKVDEITSQGGVRRYLGQYIGKERQKELPCGVDGAGRWWSRSRGLRLAILEEIVWLDPSEGYRKPVQLGIVRILRRYVERRFKRRYRGGAFVDYGGKLSGVLSELATRLRRYYGWSPSMMELLEKCGWEVVPERASEVDLGGGDDEGSVSGDSAEPRNAGGSVGAEAGTDGRGAEQEGLVEAGRHAAYNEGSGAVAGTASKDD